MTKRDFLFEVGAEEMPPKAVEKLGLALSESIIAGIDAAGVGHGIAKRFVTPRRLAVLVKDLTDRQPDRTIERRGPPLAASFDGAGVATQAAIAFARSCGVDVSALGRLTTAKGAWLSFQGTEAGADTTTVLPSIVERALASLPIPKRMRWGTHPTEFVRPVHWIVMLFGADVVEAQILGLAAGRTTFGHRFHHPHRIHLKSPSSYESSLKRAKVIVDSDQRREVIRHGVKALSTGSNRTLVDEALLDEVNALVEWPVPIAASFDKRFLELPREVVISTIQHHQRYFAIETADGELTNQFITISNIDSLDPTAVRHGNERVVRPRLSDAAFFWEQDRRISLSQHAEALKRVTFQAKLGSYADKSSRVKSLTDLIGRQFGATDEVSIAANLAKADLTTAMVNEFPDLQGTMGRYYALAEGLPAQIAVGIEEQYLPRFAADGLPKTVIGRVLALADRLDTLTGIFAIGDVPTGAKDPFALRRAAVGILRILIDADIDLDLAELVGTASANQPVQRAGSAAESYEFIIDRMRGLTTEGSAATTTEMWDAVLAANTRSPVDILARLYALREFMTLPDAASLCAANKRISNILKKATVDAATQVDASLLREPSERRLFEELRAMRPQIEASVAQHHYALALQQLTTLRGIIDTFFDQVMVMDENPVLRTNRLALLRDLRTLIGAVADLARLPG